MIQRVMTAQDFVNHRGELPDGGQWAELIRGVPVTLSPPDIEHGTIVLNLSKAFSAYVHATLHGYPCFDLGLQVERAPDTVFFPPVSYFTEGPRFAEADREYTETVPSLVVELTTTADRRRQIGERVQAYQRHGVPVVWLIDPNEKVAHLCAAGRPAVRLDQDEMLSGSPLQPEFQVRVGDLFEPPSWA